MSARLDENKIHLESTFSWLIAINYHYILNMYEGVTTDQPTTDINYHYILNMYEGVTTDQ